MNEKPIAFRKLKAVSVEGNKFDLEIIVGQPYEVSETEWSCPVSLKSLDRKLYQVSGIDSLQALILTLSMVKILVEDFIEKGGKIYWFIESESISVDELLHL